MTTETPILPISPNPNTHTPVQGEPQAVISPGSVTTFDTLDEVMEAKNEQKQDAIKEKAEEQVQVQEKVKEILEEKGKGKVETVAEELKGSLVKKILAVDGDKPIEITPTTTIRHKVDGKEVEIQVQDLLDNYSGKMAWRQRFTELDKQKKGFEAQLKAVGENLQTLSKLVSEGRSYDALEHLCDIAGIDKIEFLKGYVSEAEQVTDQFSAMSDEQKEAFFTKKQSEELRAKLKSKEEKEKSELTKTQLKAEIDTLCQKANISTEEFGANLNYLISEKYFDERPNISPQEVAKEVISYTALVRGYDKASRAIAKVNPKAVENKQLLDSLAEVANTDLSEEDLVYIVKRVLQEETSKASTSVETSQEAKKASSKEDKGKKAESEKADSKEKEPGKEKKAVFWDDLDDLYS